MEESRKLEQLKRKYRARYCQDRSEDLPDLQRGNKMFSAIQNYFGDLGETNVLTHKLADILMSADSETEHPPDVNNCDEKLFSEESEDDAYDVIPSLIEGLNEAASESDSLSTKSPAKSRERLYSSDSSVVQEPPIPTSNLHARKCLSFKDATLTENNNVFTRMASKTSEEKLPSKISIDDLENNTQASRLHKAEKPSVGKLDATKVPITSYTENADIGEEDEEFVISEESNCNLKSWVTTPKNTKAPRQRPEREKLISTEPKVNLGKRIDFQRQKSEIIRECAIDLSVNRRNSYRQKETHTGNLLDPKVFINTATPRHVQHRFSSIVSEPSTSVAVEPVDADLQIDNISDFKQHVILPLIKSKVGSNIRSTESSEISVHKHNVQFKTVMPQKESLEKNVQLDEDFSPEEMATVNFLVEEDFLEGIENQDDPRPIYTECKAEEHLKNGAFLRDVAQEPLFGEHLSQKDPNLTNKMPEDPRSKQKRQSSRKTALIEQIVSNLENNKALLSKSRAVTESDDEEVDIVDISNLKKQIILPRPGKTKAARSLQAESDNAQEPLFGENLSQEDSNVTEKMPEDTQSKQRRQSSGKTAFVEQIVSNIENNKALLSKSRVVTESDDEEFDIVDISNLKKQIILPRPGKTKAAKSLQAESDNAQEPLCGENLVQEDSKVTEKMIEDTQSKQRRQSSGKTAFVEQIVSNIENNKALLSKSRAVTESDEEEFDIVDISNLKKQIILPRPGKSKAAKSLQAEIDIAQEPLFGENLSQEDYNVTKQMPEDTQSKQRRQSSRKTAFVKQIVSNFENNKALLSKSKAVTESVDEEFDIVDISNLKQQIILSRPGKSKAVKSLHATVTQEMSVNKKNVQGVSHESSLKERSSKKFQGKTTYNNDLCKGEIQQKHFQVDDTTYSSPEETTRVQISKKRHPLEERNNEPSPSKLHEWKPRVQLKKVALAQAKTSVDEVPLTRDHLTQQESNLRNKKPNRRQSKQRRQSSRPRTHVRQIVTSKSENNKSSATSNSRGRGLKSTVTDEVEMPVLETKISADSSHNVVNQNKSGVRSSKRISLPPGMWWSTSGKSLLQGASGPVKKQTKGIIKRKSINVPKSKKGKGEQKMKEKEDKLMQTRKAKKEMKMQTNKDNKNSKLMGPPSQLRKQIMPKRSSRKDLPKGSDNTLQTDSNLSQTSTVQDVCNVIPNLSRKRKHVDETDKAEISLKKKIKSILKNHSKGSPGFEDIGHLDSERLEDGNSADESEESGTQLMTGMDHHSNYHSQQNTCSPCFMKSDKIDSVFQSGPVLRPRPVRITSPVEPLVCALNSPGGGKNTLEKKKKTQKTKHLESTEPYDEENMDNFAILSASDTQSKALVGDENGTIKKKINTNVQCAVADACEEDILNVIPIVWDPDSKSDAVVDCIHPSERSKFIGNEYFKIWTSYQHNMFTTGKLKLAPLKEKVNTASMFDIITYYVANGLVKLTLHKSFYTLKTGDIFFIPPGNAHTIRNLQKEEAVLTFTIISLSGVNP